MVQSCPLLFSAILSDANNFAMDMNFFGGGRKPFAADMDIIGLEPRTAPPQKDENGGESIKLETR